MNIGKYRVHRVSDVTQVVPVIFEGNTVHASVTGLEVELTPVDDPRHGTLTLRFVGQSIETAKVEFVTDGEGLVDWTSSAPEELAEASHQTPKAAVEDEEE